MLVSYKWLKEYLEGAPSPREIAEALTMSGTEVESVTEKGAEISNVVTAQVLSCDRHPNADRLRYCRVKTDKSELNIVCGASNMKPGDKVALALVGAELPKGLKIKKSKIRGLESEGMMCSEVELGLKDTSEGIMILPEDAPLGKDIREYLGLDDALLEVSITPNRADLLSVRGLAREIAAVTGAVFKEKAFTVRDGAKRFTPVSVKIEEGAVAACAMYSARVITGVKVGPSPDEIRLRLEAHGLRSINNVVDVTNLVLLESGHPLHAFDLDRLGGRGIRVRFAREGESIETIDGKTRPLDPAILVIADSERPVAVAGVMGGKATEVTEETVDILLESAWFEPAIVRAASKRLGLSTDSSYRFERGADIGAVKGALDMAASMISALAGGNVETGVFEDCPRPLERSSIEFRLERVGRLLGIEVPRDIIAGIFNRLHIVAREASDGIFACEPPSFRLDLKEETDLVEEVARVYGYGRIPVEMPVAPLRAGEAAPLSGIRLVLRKSLQGAGFSEAVNYSFVSRGLLGVAGHGRAPVEVMNPLSEDHSVMRQALMPSLLENLRRNISMRNEDARLFEIAPVYLPSGGRLPCEEWRASAVAHGLRWGSGWNYKKDVFDFFDVKGLLEMLMEALGLSGELDVRAAEGQISGLFHPGKSAALMINGKVAGVFGEVHPDLCAAFDLKVPAAAFEIALDPVKEAVFAARKKYSELARFPGSERDIAFIVETAVPYAEIVSAIKRLGTNIIERVELFDVYCGSNIPPGKRSLAVRLSYRASDRTLTHQEVETIHARIAGELSGRFGAEIRGEEKKD